MLGEFALSSASELGLSWEVHERCRSSFEELYLHSLFLHVQGLARLAAASSPPDPGICTACASLFATLLSWDFR